jgi:hypothetical protein
MPKPSETSVFTRTDNTAGNQEKVEKLASQWKGKGIEITVGPERITFITPPGLQSRGEDSVKNLRAQMEKDVGGKSDPSPSNRCSSWRDGCPAIRKKAPALLRLLS